MQFLLLKKEAKTFRRGDESISRVMEDFFGDEN